LLQENEALSALEQLREKANKREAKLKRKRERKKKYRR
jgi:hypothetical protein